MLLNESRTEAAGPTSIPTPGKPSDSLLGTSEQCIKQGEQHK